MDLSTQYQQHQNLQHQQEASQAYDPSQGQAYDLTTQAYYAYHQYNQFNQQQQFPYSQDYTGVYQHHHPQQQSQQESTSIHPPGVPIPPEPTQIGGTEQRSGRTHFQKQQQQLNSSDSAGAAALSRLTQFAGNMDAAQRAVAGVQEQQWQGNSGGFGPVPAHSGPHPSIGQSPYRGAGRRGGKPFRGGGRGHFGTRPDGSGPSFRGRGRGGGRGRHFPPTSASTPALYPSTFIQGEPYPSGPGQAPLLAPAQVCPTPVWPPPRMAWCELCRVDCNTPEILEQHKNGKRHKKNLQVYEELQNLNKLLVGGQNEQPKQEVPVQAEKVEGSGNKQAAPENLSSEAVTENKVETEQQKTSEAGQTEESAKKPRMDHFGARGRGFKRKMRGGRGGKWMRTYEGSRRPVEPPKPKEVIPLICELCNVKCDSQVVFETHLAGKKHLANLKRFEGHQAMLGQAALQALYPALQALYPALQALYSPNPNAATSFVPQFPQQGFHDPQGLIAQPGPSMFPQGQASEPGPAAALTLGPSLVLESQDQLDSKPEGSQVTSEAGSQKAVKMEAKIQQQPAVKFEAEPAGSNDNKYGNGTSISKGKEVKLSTEAEEALSVSATDKASTNPESDTAPFDQFFLPGADSKMEDLESESEEPTE
ncbi:hypothetical protein F0562_014734 [Nyssa sinensis]|uniref:U1-type domain-containing protein n=1 Tax=Nyssa sinensis TaxID=561372 RepID=A0A5J4ZRX9_9ASTE|nr:hypothetical protein F0562_014734 [Nyssa sinensis]